MRNLELDKKIIIIGINNKKPIITGKIYFIERIGKIETFKLERLDKLLKNDWNILEVVEIV